MALTTIKGSIWSPQENIVIPPFTGAVPRALSDKLEDSVSIKDFGATGDGVTDDTAAIQAAINWASFNHRILYAPAGHYIFTTIYFNYDAANNPNFNSDTDYQNSITIVGDGQMMPHNVFNGPSKYIGTVFESTITSGSCFIASALTYKQGNLKLERLSVVGHTSDYVINFSYFQAGSALKDIFVHNDNPVGSGVILNQNYWEIIIENLNVIGPHFPFLCDPSAVSDGNGVAMVNSNGDVSSFRFINSRGFNTGIYIADSSSTDKQPRLTFTNCLTNCNNIGFHISGKLSGIRLIDCHAERNTYHNLLVESEVRNLEVINPNFILVTGTWQTGMTYSVGRLVRSGTSHYKAVTSGVAGATAPTGTGTNINDGGVLWDYVGEETQTVYSNINLATACVFPKVRGGLIQVAAGTSGIKLIEDNTMHPVIEDCLFEQDGIGSTTGICINANSSTLAGLGHTRRIKRSSTAITLYDTPAAFKEVDPGDGTVQTRVRDVAISATLSVANDKFIRVSGAGTPVTAIGAQPAGSQIVVQFNTPGATITHNSTSLKLPGLTNYTTTNFNAQLTFVTYDGTNWVCTAIAD